LYTTARVAQNKADHNSVTTTTHPPSFVSDNWNIQPIEPSRNRAHSNTQALIRPPANIDGHERTRLLDLSKQNEEY